MELREVVVWLEGWEEEAEGRGRGRELPRRRGEGEREVGPRRKVRTERGVDMGVGGVSWCHRAEAAVCVVKDWREWSRRISYRIGRYWQSVGSVSSVKAVLLWW
ncbi:hypothetical protein VE01_10800 [Pseudogymnoascus verrucosus]|uniref:Uncharacterized protein n=1 Tax=Pseudogymnoascus verrucosus TaxID=342668 RepID=A0A2P6FGY3_9PEZI|nr:uncharacterized protein VE01_10800 [Pseudogymnoascus verrucosus]PQM43904.1 hypothetical protein VE01_10800 [Pseudogymnoascus verrucosus]